MGELTKSVSIDPFEVQQPPRNRLSGENLSWLNGISNISKVH